VDGDGKAIQTGGHTGLCPQNALLGFVEPAFPTGRIKLDRRDIQPVLSQVFKNGNFIPDMGDSGSGLKNRTLSRTAALGEKLVKIMTRICMISVYVSIPDLSSSMPTGENFIPYRCEFGITEWTVIH
jgi:hypothetical protein